VLAPKMALYGRDRSDEQLALLRRRHSELKADIGQVSPNPKIIQAANA
jgi:hypothetical protein